MVGLLDIVGADAPDHVMVRGQKLPVTGVPAVVVARILRDVPGLQEAISERSFDKLNYGEIAAIVPELVAPFIAAGLGHYGDEAYEVAADKLSISEQVAIITKIVEVSFPDGIGPFVDSLAGLVERVTDEAGGVKVKARSTNSRQASPSSAAKATPAPT